MIFKVHCCIFLAYVCLYASFLGITFILKINAISISLQNELGNKVYETTYIRLAISLIFDKTSVKQMSSVFFFLFPKIVLPFSK